MTATRTGQAPAKKKASTKPSLRFEAARLESLFVALDAVAWLDQPTGTEVAQFAGIDPRTAGKLLKNALQVGLVDSLQGKRYVSLVAYPFRGRIEDKRLVVREVLSRLPLVESIKQFLKLGDSLDVALRKAATINGISPFEPAALRPLVEWANSLNALKVDAEASELIAQAEIDKSQRHKRSSGSRVVFISHSSQDKEFVRKLGGDLTANEIAIWLDEQRIKVGESIPDKLAQGLAGADYFLFVSSKNSVQSEWVKKELNSALVTEVQKRKVHILPVKIDSAELPLAIKDKKYADFSKSYKDGLEELLAALREGIDG